MVLAKSVDCRIFTSSEKNRLNEKCDFVPVNKILGRVDCTSLNGDELNVMGSRCAIGKKVLAKSVDCTTMTA